MWQISSQTDFVPFLTDFVPFLTDFVPHRFRPISNRFRPISDRFRPIFDKFCPGLWEIILCYTQNKALTGIIYSVILHSVLLQPICIDLDFLKRLAYLLYGSVPSSSSNIEAWPYGTSLRFPSLLHLGH